MHSACTQVDADRQICCVGKHPCQPRKYKINSSSIYIIFFLLKSKSHFASKNCIVHNVLQDSTAATQTQHQMECWFWLNIVESQCPSILQLLLKTFNFLLLIIILNIISYSSINEALLIGRNIFFVPYHCLHAFNRAFLRNNQPNIFASQCLHSSRW